MPVHALEVIAGKAINDRGEVGILVSHGYGAGWYTWHYNEDLLFDPVVVRMIVDNKSHDEILEYCQKTYGDDAYYGGIDGLAVHWLTPGTQFRIDEYDGAESLVLAESQTWHTA